MAALGGALTLLLGGLVGFPILRFAGDALAPPGASAAGRVPFLGGNPPAVHAWEVP